MSIATDEKLLPVKVVIRAEELGMHQRCLENDVDGACSSCVEIIHTAFDEFYGHADNSDDVYMMILSDILDDRKPIS